MGVPPPILTWDGGMPHSDLGMGYPPIKEEWDTPSPQRGWGYSHQEGCGTPHQGGWGTPLSAYGGTPPWSELTHKLKLLPSSILRMRPVISIFRTTSLTNNNQCATLRQTYVGSCYYQPGRHTCEIEFKFDKGYPTLIRVLIRKSRIPALAIWLCE